eukprot:9108944-Alexandrium_andersonii.AAC.1
MVRWFSSSAGVPPRLVCRTVRREELGVLSALGFLSWARSLPRGERCARGVLRLRRLPLRVRLRVLVERASLRRVLLLDL